MITTESGMDDRSLEIKRNGEHVGYVQWHSGREPHISLTHAFSHLTLKEVETVVQNYTEHRIRRGL